MVVRFLLENIFARNRMSRAIISDQGTYFDNRSFNVLLKRYSIVHHLAPLKRYSILEMTVNMKRKDWVNKLIDPL